MRIIGKNNIVIAVPFLMLLASFGLVTFVYEEADILYEVSLTSIYTDNVRVWGNIHLKITNNRDSLVGFTDIDVDLLNPETEKSFYSYHNNGGYLQSGSSIGYNINFNMLLKDLPEAYIIVSIEGYLYWDGEYIQTTKLLEVPITVEV